VWRSVVSSCYCRGGARKNRESLDRIINQVLQVSKRSYTSRRAPIPYQEKVGSCVYPCQCVTVRVERLDDITGLRCLDDVIRVGRDGEGSDEAEGRWEARALVLWLWF
jgi:hypothetical protein